MQQACPGWKPSCFIVDAAPAPMNAIRAVFGDDVKIFICTWHFFKALKKNLNSKVRSFLRALRVFLRDASPEITHTHWNMATMDDSI